MVIGHFVACALMIQSFLQFQNAPKVRPEPTDQGTVTLQMQGARGDRCVYNVESHLEFVDGSGGLSMTDTMTEVFIREVENEVEWETTFLHKKIEASGKMQSALGALDAINGLKLTFAFSRRNRPLRLTVMGKTEQTRASEVVIYPPGPVKIGDTWKAPILLAKEVVSATNQLVEVRKVNGRDTAIIQG